MYRLKQEISHGRRILHNAEKIWGWATPAGQKRVERRVNFLKRLGELKEGKNILKIGCGTGVFTKKLAETKANIVSIDISPDLITKARENIKYPNVSFHVMNIENMDFEDNCFDSIIGVSILHHVNLIPALLEIRRCLKEQGKIVFAEPNMMNPQIMVQKNIKPIGKLLGDLPTETSFFRWRIEAILRNIGYSSIRVEPFDFLHPWIPSFLINTVEKIGLFVEKLPLIREISGYLIIKAVK